MFELLNETLFEKHMAEYLAGSRMYNQRTPKDFNIQKLVDSDMLFTIFCASNLCGRNLSLKVSQTNKMRSTL